MPAYMPDMMNPRSMNPLEIRQLLNLPPISFEPFRVTDDWDLEDYEDRIERLTNCRLDVLTHAEKDALLEVLLDDECNMVPFDDIENVREKIDGDFDEAYLELLKNEYEKYYNCHVAYKLLAAERIGQLRAHLAFNPPQ